MKFSKEAVSSSVKDLAKRTVPKSLVKFFTAGDDLDVICQEMKRIMKLLKEAGKVLPSVYTDHHKQHDVGRSGVDGRVAGVGVSEVLGTKAKPTARSATSARAMATSNAATDVNQMGLGVQMHQVSPRGDTWTSREKHEIKT